MRLNMPVSFHRSAESSTGQQTNKITLQSNLLKTKGQSKLAELAFD